MFEFTMCLVFICPLCIFFLIVLGKKLPHDIVKSGHQEADGELAELLGKLKRYITELRTYLKFICLLMLVTAATAQNADSWIIVSICVVLILTGVLFVLVFLGATLGFTSIRIREEVIENHEFQVYVLKLQVLSRNLICLPALFVVGIAVLLWIYFH